MTRDQLLVAIVISLTVAIGYLLYTVFNIQVDSAQMDLDSATMPYRDQLIRLSKAYRDYDAYVDDPENIAAEEIPRVQELVKTAPIPQGALGREQMNSLISEIKFPGYGEMSLPRVQENGVVLQVYAIEIPRADQWRIIVFRQTGNQCRLVDDFVQEDDLVPEVKEELGELIYHTRQGNIIARHKPLQ